MAGKRERSDRARRPTRGTERPGRGERPARAPARRAREARGIVALLAMVVAVGAAAAALAPPGASVSAAGGESIVVAGKRIPIGTRVVLWDEKPFFDAAARRRHDRPDVVLPERPAPGCDTPERIGKRAGVASAGDLGRAVHQFVIHYDEAWTSANCFHVLQDIRGLSVHFLCDQDGTIYQTCDAIERCRHARAANDRSVGVEVAHPGALTDALAGRYRRDARGVFLAVPERFGAAPFRVSGFVPRPARPEPVRGRIHGREIAQYDFTDEQYEALARLAAGLARALPRIRLDAPRDSEGRVRTGVLGEEEAAAFEGILGHYHLQTDKTDPGPAFDWERVLKRAEAVRSAREPL